ncbi:GNAT family N-acetyltransferase [Aquabacter spiritensis]|uniref:Putative N-acetyltransferase YhbS n=1 Tax=Aquabacter spiritensis TaxID=933073 RepID=A0A4R3M464_9HYPH|nr:N-acetyltransferase [Aquabacter spiritensis]TCT08071.1 putative N-acetyltransferase YhbS [Aquabacter spiritensis]
MTDIVAEKVEEAAAREALLDLTMPTRFEKPSERIREGRLPAEGLAFAAHGPDGRLIATVRLWHVAAGPGKPALLLGPLAVHPWFRDRGLGGKMMQAAIATAAERGHGAILLVGDAPYYSRFGFSAAPTQGLWMPGAYDRDRLLGLELTPGALTGARGLISPTGAQIPVPSLGELMAASAA